MDADLRVAVIGCGMISADHFTAWSRCNGARVIAICDSVRERVRARGDQFGIRAQYDDAEQMISAKSPDILDIITSRESHASLVRLAARHGIPALCEKPLCPTHSEAVGLVHDIGAARVMVNENWRYRTYFRVIADWLRAGRLGIVTQVRIALWRSSMLQNPENGRIHSLTRQPFLATEERVLIAESLIHEIDVVRALFGEVQVIGCATARAGTKIVGEDSATILLRTEYGLPITIDGVMTAAGHEVRAPDRLEIAGTRCSVLLENATLQLTGTEKETIAFDEANVRQDCFSASIQHFVDQIRSGGPFWTSALDQLESLRVMEDAYRIAGAPRQLNAVQLPPVMPPRIEGFD